MKNAEKKTPILFVIVLKKMAPLHRGNTIRDTLLIQRDINFFKKKAVGGRLYF